MKAPTIDKNLHDVNLVAKMNRRALSEADVLAIRISGGPGCGKTSLIDASIDRLMPDVHVSVIACDVASNRDADRIVRHTEQVVQVNTGEQSTVDATHVREALSWLDLNWCDLLFIENVGTLLGPVTSDLGQDVTVAMFSVAAGHDKADKHPDLVRAANVVILNKVDLIPAVPFDSAAFRADVKRLNPSAVVFELSALRGQGMEGWIDWLKKRVNGHPHAGTASKWFG
jgi:hydrogenase nickel incorporation protein HypB